MIKKTDRKRKGGTTKQEDSLGGAAKSLLEALVFLVILVVLVISAVLITTYISKNRAAVEQPVVKEEITAKLPWDVPLYEGSILTRYTHSGKTAIFEYDMPQGSIGSVQAFYKEQLEIHEWIRQSRSSQYVSEYVDPSQERTMLITLSYRSAKVHMKLQIVTNKK